MKLKSFLFLSVLFLFACNPGVYDVSNATNKQKLESQGWDCEYSWIVFHNKSAAALEYYIDEKVIAVPPKKKTKVKVSPGEITVREVVMFGWGDHLKFDVKPCHVYTHKIKR